MKHHFLFAALVMGISVPSGPALAADTPKPSAKAPAKKMSLVGGSWLAEDIENKGVIDNARTFVRFDAVDKVSGNGGKNKFTGTCVLGGGKITIGDLRSTKMAGVEALIHQENAFFKALGKVRSYHFDENGTLFMQDATGGHLLRLTRLENP